MLLVALVFLVLLTLLAIGASSGSLLQQRMVSATRSSQLATMSADATLRGAEWRIWSTAAQAGNVLVCDSSQINATSGCVKHDASSPLYAVDGDVRRFRTGNNAWLSLTGPITYKFADGSGFTNNTGTDYAATANIADNPQYIIEDMGRVQPPGTGPQHEAGVSGVGGGPNGGPGGIDINVYRITARATGGTRSTVRVVQSTFDAQGSN